MFTKTTLAATVAALLSSSAMAAPVLFKPAAPEQAQNAQMEAAVNLGTLTATTDRLGAKSKTNVITSKMQEESTETDLRGLLAEEPSIGIGGGNGTSQFYYIRGMGQNSIDVKVDNAYADSQIHYHQGRFMLDPAMVKIVSIQKGAGSASAGIGATNGAIVAKTIDAKDLLKNTNKNFGAKVHAGAHTNSGHSFGASAFGSANGFDAVIAANHIAENTYEAGSGYKNLLGSNKVTYSKLDKTSYLAKVGYEFGNSRISLSHMQENHSGNRPVREEFDFANSELTTTAAELDAVKKANAPFQSVEGWKLGDPISPNNNTRYVVDAQGNKVPNLARNVGSDKKMKQSTTNLEFNAQGLGFAESVTANIYRMNVERESADDSNNGYAGKVSGKTTMGFKTTGANLNFDTALNPNTLVKYGVNYRTQEVKPNKFFDKNDKTGNLNPPLNNQQKTDVGVYAEAINHYGDFILTAGARYDHFKIKAMDGKTVTGGAVSPSIGAIYSVSPALSVHGNLSYATRSPRLYDAITAGGNRGVVTFADKIKAERATNTEIGFNYKTGDVNAYGTLFWQRINNAIGNFADKRHGTNEPIVAIKNVGHMTNKGYELGASWQLGNVTVRGGVAHSNPKMVEYSPKALSQNPEFAVQTGRTWTGSVAYRFAQPNLEVGVRNRTVESVNAVLLEGAEPQKRDGYSVSDIFANWKPYGNDTLNVNFAVDNVFNKNYRSHAQRPAVNTLPGAGRDFRVGVNYTF